MLGASVRSASWSAPSLLSTAPPVGWDVWTERAAVTLSERDPMGNLVNTRSLKGTSTATVALAEGDRTWLRMYGNLDGLPVEDLAANPPLARLTQEPNPPAPAGAPLRHVSIRSVIPEEAANIGYIDSTTPTNLGSPAVAYEFALARTTGTYEVRATNISSGTARRTLDGVARQISFYKDVHVLAVPTADGHGGWLMLAARYDSDVWRGPEGDESPGVGNSSSAIVGWFCRDPDFVTGVQGPFFLVGRWHDVAMGIATRWPLWLGVPAAAVVETEDESWLYVYYTADFETSWGVPGGMFAAPPVGFRPGTYLRRIRLSSLPWRAFSGRIECTHGWLSVADATDESLWNSVTEDHLVVGESLGKVRVWTSRTYAAGAATYGAPWHAGDDPATFTNAEVESVGELIQAVDAVPVIHDGALYLYVCLNAVANRTPSGGLPYGWGIWRTVAGPAAAGRVFGQDFVLRWIDTADAGGTEDCVARSNPADKTNLYYDDGSLMRLDPDPVRLPSGEWIVFTGAVDSSKAGVQVALPLSRFDTTEYNGDRRFRSEWTP